MMHLFFNALGAKAAAGLTYVRNIVPHLARYPKIRATFLVQRELRREFGELGNISWIEVDPFKNGLLTRLWREQHLLPGLISGSGADILISTGNFALFHSPVPQILLSGNALYWSADFQRDILARRNFRLWTDTVLKGWMAKESIKRAHCTVTPSEAMAEEIRKGLRGHPAPIRVIPHGFDPETFFANERPLPRGVEQRLDGGQKGLRLLFVSHYNYFRNYDTLIRSLPLLKNRLGEKKVKLVLTCELRPRPEWGAYRVDGTARLVKELGLGGDLVELGLIPYPMLHKVYKACSLYVTPSYAESFAHPLVEAMACGLPIVASDLPVHREVCGDAALYFPRFSPEGLAERLVELINAPDLAEELRQRGAQRFQDFSWKKHVSELVNLAEDLVRGRRALSQQSPKDWPISNPAPP